MSSTIVPPTPYPKVVKLVIDGVEVHGVNASLSVINHAQHCSDVNHMNACPTMAKKGTEDAASRSRWHSTPKTVGCGRNTSLRCWTSITWVTWRMVGPLITDRQ